MGTKWSLRLSEWDEGERGDDARHRLPPKNQLGGVIGRVPRKGE